MEDTGMGYDDEIEEEEEYLQTFQPAAVVIGQQEKIMLPQFTLSSTQNVLIPPLQPVSPQDIISYAELDLALRSHPEMAKEGAGVLNARAVARLVDGIRSFQSIHLGLGSDNAIHKKWPMVKIPDEVFRDRTKSGPLFTAIISAYRSKKDYSWRQFDFSAPKRYQENINLLKRMEKDLIEANMLQRPIIYLDETIPENTRLKYIDIIQRFGGQHISKINFDGVGEDGSTRPTHIVAWDTEEHDKDESIREEEELAAKDQIAKLYFRTMAVIDPANKRNSNSGGIVQSLLADSKKKGGKSDNLPILEDPMALIHWWYWPSSYDEWVAASEVDGVSDHSPSCSDQGLYVVSGRFIRDVEKFNEWGSEADYAIANFENKVIYFNKLAEEKKRLEAIMAENDTKNMTDITGTDKKAPGLKIKFSIPASSGKDASSNTGNHENQMGPRSLIVGFDFKGGKMRRTVYDDALHIPAAVLDMVHGVMGTLSNHVSDQELSSISIKPRTLPGIASLLRPSVDPQYSSKFLVKEMRLSTNGGTLVQNKTFKSSIQEFVPRIRGGGTDEDDQSGAVDDTTLSVAITDGDDFAEQKRAMNEVDPPIFAEATSENVSQDMSLDADETEVEYTVDYTDETGRVDDKDSSLLSDASTLVNESLKDKPSQNADTVRSDHDSTITSINAQDKPQTPATKRNIKIIPLAKDLTTISTASAKAPLTLEQEPTTETPSWYDSKSVSDFEMTLLPEWFNSSALHRTRTTYIQARERIIDLARENVNGKYITATVVRRCIPGDIGSLVRLHNFLSTFGFINGSAMGETQPTDFGFLEQYSIMKPGSKSLTNESKCTRQVNPDQSKERKHILAAAVVEQIQKKQRLVAGDAKDVEIDWVAISNTLADGSTPSQVHRDFLTLSFDATDDMTIVTTETSQVSGTIPSQSLSELKSMVMQDLMDKVHPDVQTRVINAALEATLGDLQESSNAAAIGLIVSEALNCARDQETSMKTIMKEIMDQRMLKLETRLSYLDDIEALLDTERVALELERRDLYTARCRQWFGDGK